MVIRYCYAGSVIIGSIAVRYMYKHHSCMSRYLKLNLRFNDLICEFVNAQVLQQFNMVLEDFSRSLIGIII